MKSVHFVFQLKFVHFTVLRWESVSKLNEKDQDEKGKVNSTINMPSFTFEKFNSISIHFEIDSKSHFYYSKMSCALFDSTNWKKEIVKAEKFKWKRQTLNNFIKFPFLI